MASLKIRNKWFSRAAAGVQPKIVVPLLTGFAEEVGLEHLTPMLQAGTRSTTGTGGTVGSITAQFPAVNTVVKMGSKVNYTVRV